MIKKMKENGKIKIFDKNDYDFEKLDKYVRYRLLRGEECDGNVIRNKMVKNYV
jgi:hypothetical protein